MRYTTVLSGLVVAAGLAFGGTAVAEDASNAFDGEYAYQTGCGQCHGAGGEGWYPMGVPLKGNSYVQNVPAQVIVELVKNGRDDDQKSYPEYNGMPAFKGFKPHGEIEAIVRYIKGPLQQ